MRPLQRSSEFLFFALGIAMIACLVLLKKGVEVELLTPIISSLDLPLLLSGMIFAGSSFYVSIRKDKAFSPAVAAMIAVPLLVIFCVFAYFNFALPSRVMDDSSIEENLQT